jgi:alpha-N-arabinofuranosidase
VLETCWDKVDYLAMHYYATNHEDDTASFLGLASHFEQHVDTLAGMMRYVKALRRSNHDVKLSWDEWNVWYKDRSGAGGWTEAPRLSEEVYNLEDALVVAQWMSVFLRRCDVLEIACIAQVANVISPLTTSRDGLLRHTTYYPFVLFGQNASGVSLDALVKAPEVETNKYGALPALDVSATYDAEQDAGAVFIVNRSLTDTIETEIAWQGIAPAKNTAIIQISGDDPKAINTFENPNNIVPQQLKSVPVQNGTISVTLPPMSFTVVKTAGYEG